MSKPVAIITGAASGIGLALTKHLLAKQWRVIMADVNQASGDAAAQELGKDVLFIKTDVSNWTEQAALFKKAFLWGERRLDFFAANAGIADRQSIYEMVEGAEVDVEPLPLNLDALKVDLDAVIQGIWLFVHYTRRNKNPGGKIVVTSSAAGLYPMDTCPQYSAAKHALVGLTRSLGPTFLKENITVNCICPAFVPTGLAPKELLTVWPEEHITPMSTVLRAYDTFIGDDAMSGQTVELSQDQLFFREQPPYANESQRWVGQESAALWEKAYPSGAR